MRGDLLIASIGNNKTISNLGSKLAGKFRAQVGDSFIVTDTGYEQITTHPNTLAEVTI